MPECHFSLTRIFTCSTILSLINGKLHVKRNLYCSVFYSVKSMVFPSRKLQDQLIKASKLKTVLMENQKECVKVSKRSTKKIEDFMPTHIDLKKRIQELLIKPNYYFASFFYVLNQTSFSLFIFFLFLVLVCSLFNITNVAFMAVNAKLFIGDLLVIIIERFIFQWDTSVISYEFF